MHSHSLQPDGESGGNADSCWRVGQQTTEFAGSAASDSQRCCAGTSAARAATAVLCADEPPPQKVGAQDKQRQTKQPRAEVTERVRSAGGGRGARTAPGSVGTAAAPFRSAPAPLASAAPPPPAAAASPPSRVETPCTLARKWCVALPGPPWRWDRKEQTHGGTRGRGTRA